MPILNGLLSYWEKFPPVNETFALFVEYGKTDEERKQSSTQPSQATSSGNRITVDSRESLDAAMILAGMMGGGNIVRSKKKA